MEAQEETSTLSQVNNEGQNKDTHSEVTSTNSKEHSDESRGTVSPVEGDAVEGGVGGGVGGSSNTAAKKGKTSWKQPEKKNLSKEEKRANRDSWPSLEEAVTPPPETTTPPTPSPSSTSSTTPSSSLASPTSSSPTNSSNPLPSTSSSLLSTPPTSASPAFQSIPSTSSGSSSTSKRGKKGMNWVPFKDIGPPPSSHFKHSNNQNHNPNNLNSNTNSTHNNGRRRNNRDFNSDRSERNEKGDRQDRGERSDRGDRADRGERTDRAERGERDRERADRGDRGDRGERGHGDRNYRNNNFRHGRTRGRGYSNHYNNRQNAQYGSGSARVPLFTPQYFPKEDLKELITKQIEYYFSVENLCHDIFLRTHMDEEGWVAVTLIAQFPRILQLSSDQPLLIEAIKASQILELKDEKLRLTKDWQTWLIPKASALLSTPLIPSPTSNAVVETQHEVESTHVENTPSTASQAETAV